MQFENSFACKIRRLLVFWRKYSLIPICVTTDNLYVMLYFEGKKKWSNSIFKILLGKRFEPANFKKFPVQRFVRIPPVQSSLSCQKSSNLTTGFVVQIGSVPRKIPGWTNRCSLIFESQSCKWLWKHYTNKTLNWHF